MRARAKVYERNLRGANYRHKLSRHADPRGERKFRQCDVEVDAFELDCSQKAFLVLEDLYRACRAGSTSPNYSFLALHTSICIREQDKRRGRGKTDRPNRKHGRKEGRKGGGGRGAYPNSPPPSPLPLARAQLCCPLFSTSTQKYPAHRQTDLCCRRAVCGRCTTLQTVRARIEIIVACTPTEI